MLFVIIKKELKRVFSDRRLMFSAFLLPALSIYLLYSLMGTMIGNMSDNIDEHIAIIQVVNAPESFKVYIEGYIEKKEKENESFLVDDRSFMIDVSYETIDIENINMDIPEMIRYRDSLIEGDLDVMVVFTAGFDESVVSYDDGNHPNIDLYFNPSEEFSQTAVYRFEYTILSDYQNQLLSERFGSLSSLTAFTVNANDKDHTIAKEGREAGLGISFMLPMLLNIMLFAGAMGIGIDVIAGEKERGTMATMLLAPVDRETIAFGKVISLGIVATLSATCTFGAIIASLPNASELLAAGAEVSLDSLAFTPIDFLMLFIVLIMQVGIFVALICLVSVIAKSVKEAGTYISPIYMVVMVSAFATVFTTGDVELYKFMIPILGNVFAIKELFTFDLSFVEFFATTGISTLLIAILLKLITLAFNNERTMFNS